MSIVILIATLLFSYSPLSGAQQPAAQQPAAPQPSVELPPDLARVLTDYETAWRNRDAAALSRLFAEDGFVLPSGRLPVRGRAEVERYYTGQGGYTAEKGTPDAGKFTLTLRKGEGGRWLIVSDMDNMNRR